MTPPDPSTPQALADLGFGLDAQHRVLLVADMVESVRLMQRHEWETTQRWRSLVQTLVQDVLPAHQGTLVQRRGDGLMLEFETVTGAAAAAFECHRRADAANAGQPGDQHIVLRMGLHQAEVLADGIDLYGAGVQLTHRLAALAQPGETLCTAEVRDELTDGLHAHITDKGLRQLGDAMEPIQVFSLQDEGRTLGKWASESLRPTLAFVAGTRNDRPEDTVFTRLLITELSGAAGHFNHWRVISALSTKSLTLGDVLRADPSPNPHLAAYVVEVTCTRNDHGVVVTLQCHDTAKREVIWAFTHPATAQAWLSAQDNLCGEVCTQLAQALLARELHRLHHCALHSIPGYALLLSAQEHTHRSAPQHIRRAREALEHLIQRHPRCAEARFWLGKWWFLAMIQGYEAFDAAAQHSLEHLRAATDVDADHAAASALGCHMQTLHSGEATQSKQDFTSLVERKSNEPLGWLFYSRVLDMNAQFAEASAMVDTAHSLSPLDPWNYYYQTMKAQSALSAGDATAGLLAAQEAVRGNRHHLPALTMLIIAQVWAGLEEASRQTVQDYLSLRPAASVRRFLHHHPRADHPNIQAMAQALRVAGMPD